MTSTHAPSAAAPEPKRLYRIVEPFYADLAGAEPGEFFRISAQRTQERFGVECGILGFAVATRGERGWRALSGHDASLLSCANSKECRSTRARVGFVLASKVFVSLPQR